MATLLQELQKYRFILLVGGALAGLIIGKNVFFAKPIQVNVPTSTRAGEAIEVTVSGEADQNLTLTLNQTDFTETNFSVTTNAQGKALLTLPGENLQKAGTYSLSAKTWYSKAGTEKTFNVEANLASSLHSTVSFSQNELQNGQTAQMVLTLVDDYGNPIVGHSISVSPSQNSIQVYTSEFTTNAKGQMAFTISGSANGIADFSIFDSTEGKNILGKPQLAFAGNSTSTQENPSVQLAENGPLSQFKVSGLSEKTKVNDQQSITVKALDENGFTVLDYTGTIRFSSTDSEAALPEDYTFTAEDQGEHTFSLSVKFVTPGTQTLTITDLDDITLTGEAQTEVVTSLSDSSQTTNDYNTNFETTDFTRTGDFTLISPASGSYSSSTVEVQGEGEYGNTAVIIVNEEEAGRTDIAFDNSFEFALEDLKDGTYGVYVKIVDADDTVLETSTAEKITIDTTAPSLNAVSADPNTDLEPNASVVITVLSESKLESAAIFFKEEVNTMTETNTPGKYQVTLVMPEVPGTYDVDVILADTLGNEAQYRKQLSLSVGESSVTETPSTPSLPEVGGITGLTATPGEEKVALAWETPQSSSTLAYYRIYYGPSPEALYGITETYDASTHWTIPNLTGNQEYYFAVSAVSVEGKEGDRSETVKATPSPGSTVPSTPSIPQETTPAITQSGNTITETPESGPATTGLVILSAAGALTLAVLRKRARV